MDSRSASRRTIRSNSRSQGEAEGLKGQSGILLTAFGVGGLQAVAFAHGDAALNQNFIGVVDDAVHDCLGNGAAGIGIGVNAGIPALGLVLGAEDHGTLAAGFCDFQQVVGLLGREWPDEPLVQDQQVHLLVGGQTFLQFAADAWYAPYVKTINGSGIVQGVGGGKYSPNSYVTWSQIITVLTRFVQPQEHTLQHIQYSGWAQQAIQTAVANGWIEDSAEFNPDAVISRGELEQLINGVLALYR